MTGFDKRPLMPRFGQCERSRNGRLDRLDIRRILYGFHHSSAWHKALDRANGSTKGKAVRKLLVPRHFLGKFCLLFLGLPVVVGCQGMSHSQSTAALGSGLGAIAGAAIGAGHGHAGTGALVGAATGALAGGLVGSQEELQAERQARAIEHADHVAAELALTNADLVRMTQSGISDQVIISTVNNRGGRFDLAPDAIISLKNHGVRDTLTLAVQPSAQHLSNPTVVPQYVVIPPPQPSVGFGVAIGSSPRHYHRRYRRW